VQQHVFGPRTREKIKGNIVSDRIMAVAPLLEAYAKRVSKSGGFNGNRLKMFFLPGMA
jgi:hypothetical protein